MFVVNNCCHETNKTYEGYEESSENCISRLYFGLNISINLNKMLINSFAEIF